MGLGGNVSAQLTLSIKDNFLDWRIGWTASADGGASSTPNAGVGLLFTLSPANDSRLWNGKSTSYGGSFGDIGPAGAGIDIGNLRSAGDTRSFFDVLSTFRIDGYIGLKGVAPWYAVPAEGHGTLGQTWGNNISIRDIWYTDHPELYIPKTPLSPVIIPNAPARTWLYNFARFCPVGF